ncbi:MAG: hypothetical protein WAO76_17695 [Georgfuchsia sp.]
MAATYWLSVAWFEWRVGSFIFLALAASLLTYCLGEPMLVLSESFVTARLLAIPLSIAGLVAATQGRIRLAVALQLIGMMFHPLVSIWGLLAVILLRLPDRLLLMLVVLWAGLMTLLYMNPMDIPIFREMDHEWQEVVKATAAIVFHEHWSKLAINNALWWFSALLFGGLFGQAGLQRLYRVIALVAALALLVSLITSYFLPNIFFVQAQLWRALWLAVLIGFVAALDISWVAVRAGIIGKGIAALLALTFLFRDSGGGLFLFMSYIVWSAASDKISQFFALRPLAATKIIWILVAVAVMAGLPDILMDFWIIAGMERAAALGLLENYWDMSVPISLHILVPFLVWSCLTMSSDVRFYKWVIVPCLALLLLVAGIHWDHRTLARQQLESRYRAGGNRDMFAGLVMPGQQVYWRGNTLRVWFELGTASYVSSEQAIGIVFSRNRMTEVRQRLERVIMLDSYPRDASAKTRHELAARYMRKYWQSNADPMNLHKYRQNGSLSKKGLQALCRDPELDFVVSRIALPGWPVSRYSEVVGKQNVSYYLYDCNKLREFAPEIDVL